MALHRSVLKEDDILCYMRMHVLVSDYSDRESLGVDSEGLGSDNNVSTTSSRKQLRSSTGPLTTFSTPVFPHFKTFFITV